jgi:hypothetical protein
MTVGSGSKVVDIYVLYRIIKDLSTPIEETDAFKFGLIDKNGKRLRDDKGVTIKAKTKKEKAADSYYHRFIRNIKKLMSKVGLGSKVATFAAALFLLKEHVEQRQLIQGDSFEDENAVLEEIVRNMKYLEENSQKNYKNLQEEIANATGTAVVGTGDDTVHWAKQPYRVGEKGDRKKKGRYINGAAYLKKMAREAAKKKET